MHKFMEELIKLICLQESKELVIFLLFVLILFLTFFNQLSTKCYFVLENHNQFILFEEKNTKRRLGSVQKVTDQLLIFVNDCIMVELNFFSHIKFQY